MLKCPWWVLFLIFSAKNIFAANILITMDLPSQSHQIWHYTLAEGLMKKGHNVTLLGPFSDKGRRSEKYHPLVIEGVLEEIQKHPEFDIEEQLSKMSVLRILEIFIEYVCVVCSHSYRSKGFRTLLNYPEDFKFDLIIIDMSMSQCFYPLIQRFKYPPTIGSTVFLLPPFLSAVFGNALHPSYIPFYHLQYSDDMSFFQRVINHVLMYADCFFRQPRKMQQIETIAKRTFGDEMDSIESLERHISLLLSNINMAFNQPQPIPPNIIPVGGLHVKRSETLPADFQSIMDSAKDGVILFSLGTNVRSDKLKPPVIKALLDAFGQLRQIIIWKFESDLKNVPSNVIIRNWVPQNSVLAHPNLKLFINHGGALSTQEAVYYGVPIVGMPFFLEQRITVADLVKKQLGLRLDTTGLTSKHALDTIKEVLSNPMYSNNMKEMSRKMRDLQNTPLDTAVFWAEYAMRHNGTNFLSPKSRNMSLFAASSIDVLLFLFMSVFSLIYLFIALLKWCITSSRRKEKIKGE